MFEDKVVLVVDDEADLIGFVSDMLDEHGFILLTANNGIEALERLAEVERHQHPTIKKVDLILTDIKMPQMDGITLVKAARKLYPEVRRCFMTGYSELCDERLNTPTLNKPFTGRELTKFIEDVLFD